VLATIFDTLGRVNNFASSLYYNREFLKMIDANQKMIDACQNRPHHGLIWEDNFEICNIT
jgi:hypothetical protein